MSIYDVPRPGDTAISKPDIAGGFNKLPVQGTCTDIGEVHPIGAWEQTLRWSRERGLWGALGKTSREGRKEGDSRSTAVRLPKASAHPSVRQACPQVRRGWALVPSPHRNP